MNAIADPVAPSPLAPADLAVAPTWDVVIAGGGLSGGLIALALTRYRPGCRVLLLEAEAMLGGNHVWSFFATDLDTEGQAALNPLIAARWDQGYSVHFPAFSRDLDTPYRAMTSAALDAHLRTVLPPDAVRCGTRVAGIEAGAVVLADGTRISAGAVLDARGVVDLGALTGGWQKFVGLRLKLRQPHGLARPIVMDACVEQIDGYRFVYSLPFGPDDIFVEDTYYADGPALDRPAVRARIMAYAAARGWDVAEVLHEEHGVLPVVAGGDGQRYRAAGEQGGIAVGNRAGLFHPLTSYSVPDAWRFAVALARLDRLDPATLANFARDWAERHWRRAGLYRMLSALLFVAADPPARYKVIERFYKLKPGLIERFYAGRSRLSDGLRILVGKPPVPMHRAIAVIAGIGRRPQPLTHPPSGAPPG